MSNTITAVMPVFNGENYIEEALNSLLNQTVPIQNIIVVDDGSTDNTCGVIQRQFSDNPSLVLYKNDKNKGVSYARNRGCNLADTEWLLFLDADDLAKNTLVEKVQQRLSNSAAILVHSAYQQIDEIGTNISGITRFKQVDEDEMLGYELVRNHICLAGTFIKRDIFMDCGGFNPEFRICEDWDLWIKMAQKGKFIYLDEPLVLVRRHTANASSKVDKVLTAAKQILNQYSLDFIQKAIDKRKLPRVQNNLDYVSILFFLGHWEQGKNLLESEINRTPDYSEIYFYLGLYYLQVESYSEAEYYFRKATELNNHDAASWNNLGICLGIRNKFVQSKECFETALALLENYMDATINLAALERHQLNDNYKITWKVLRPVLLNYQY